MTPTFSLVINHTPWIPERVEAFEAMDRALLFDGKEPVPGKPNYVMHNCADYRGTDWQVSKVKWALDQWRWSAEKPTSHHVFMTDDLHVAPSFWTILRSMVMAAPSRPIGLLSNHPEGPTHFANGHHWYATNSWLVGPAYVLPHDFLVSFLEWFFSLPDGVKPGCKGYANDDSSLNQFITMSGLCTMHPLPTIIEHRHDLASTVGHGDEFSRERLSWRFRRHVIHKSPLEFEWVNYALDEDPTPLMRHFAWWRNPWDAPMLKVGNA